MFNEKRIEDVRKKIQVSTLLTDREKSDWLNLLDLMNDKQLGELEEILAAGGEADAASASLGFPGSPAAMPNPAASPAEAISPLRMPQLNHIANIPSDVSMARSTPVTQMPKKMVSPLKSINPLVPPLTKPASLISKSPVAAPRSVASQPSAVKVPGAALQPQPAAAPLQSQSPEKFISDHPEDLKNLTIETIRTHDLQSIVDVVRGFIQEYGYFKVLQIIESSQLYEEYINSGKERLKISIGAPAAPNDSLLTQAEFEFVADLLRHMRFNRW